jgi:GNAT superfamily N-acetyltransferase
VADVRITRNPALSDDQLNELFLAGWPGHVTRSFRQELGQCLGYFTAYDGDRLVGYVRVAWDGGVHGFLLDPVVHPDLRRLGIGTRLVRAAAEYAAGRGLEWLHVDFEPSLTWFYEQAGFYPVSAAILSLRDDL